MKNRTHRHFAAVLTLAAGLLAGTAAGASSGGTNAVYRCGPEGRLYQQTPCAQGRVVEVDDSRTAAQRAEAMATTQRLAATAQVLEKERWVREAQQARRVALVTEAPGIPVQRPFATAPVVRPGHFQPWRPQQGRGGFAPRRYYPTPDPSLSMPYHGPATAGSPAAGR